MRYFGVGPLQRGRRQPDAAPREVGGVLVRPVVVHGPGVEGFRRGGGGGGREQGRVDVAPPSTRGRGGRRAAVNADGHRRPMRETAVYFARGLVIN